MTKDEWAAGGAPENELNHLRLAEALLPSHPGAVRGGVDSPVWELVRTLVLATDMAHHRSLTQSLGEVLLPELRLGAGLSRAARLVAMKGLIKVSDLGHVYAPVAVHRRWAQGLEEEFFLQGDRERALGFPRISFMMDRGGPGVTQSQEGFFEHVAMPLLSAWAACFPEAGEVLTAAATNRASWG